MTERTEPGLGHFHQQLRQGIERSGLILMVMVAVTALLIAAKSVLDGHAAGAGPNLITWNAIAVAGAIGVCLIVGRQWGAHIAALAVATVLMVSSVVAAASYGTGIAASGMVMLYVSVVIAALFVGARAAVAYGLMGGALMIGLWALERIGAIPGLSALHAQPPGGHLPVRLAALAVITTLMSRYATIQSRILDMVHLKHEKLEASLHAEAATAAALRSREAQLGVLLDRSPTCTLVIEAGSGRLAMANEQALRVHGVATPRALDEHCFFAHPDFSRQRALAALAATVEQGAQRLAWCSKTRSGAELWWDVTLDTLEFNGKPSIVCFAHDVTDRRRADRAMRDHQVRLETAVHERTAQLQHQQERTQAILEALPITLSIVDADGRVELVNRHFEEASGLARHHVVGRFVAELTPHAEWFRPALSTARSRTLIDKVRRPRDYLVTSVVMTAPGQTGEPAVLNLGTDVTALTQLERELRVAKDEAERLARVKSEFLANMSHEIRTPLNAVLGLAQLGTRRTHDPAASRSCFDRILTSGRFLMALVNDVLDFSKLDSGKVEIVPAPCQLSALLAEAVDLVSERAREKGLVLGCAVDDRLPPWVSLDGLRVRQVLANLLSNAVKFTAEGSVFVELAARTSADTPALVVTVRDTGIGMSPEACSRIFEAFEQADTSITRRFGGTGLGLSISQQLARLMGGTLTVSSVPGRGSVFELVLPLVVAESQAPVAQAPAVAAREAPSLRGVRVLVTDDVEINREILAEMLQHAGATVQCASDGPDAIVLALNDDGEPAFDLILMDVQMPGMDGCETTRRIHERAPALPIVALTAHALPEERDRCLAAGMCAHITKPVDMAELLRVVARHVPVEAVGPGAPDIDLATALSRCAGNEALLLRLLGKFHAQYRGFAEDLEASAREGGAVLQACLHRVKGTAASLGLNDLRDAAAAVESAAPEGRSAGLAELNAAMARTLGALEPILRRGHPTETPALQRM